MQYFAADILGKAHNFLFNLFKQNLLQSIMTISQ